MPSFALAALAICYAPVVMIFIAAYKLAMTRQGDAYQGFILVGGVLGFLDLIPTGIVIRTLMP